MQFDDLPALIYILNPEINWCIKWGVLRWGGVGLRPFLLAAVHCSKHSCPVFHQFTGFRFTDLQIYRFLLNSSWPMTFLVLLAKHYQESSCWAHKMILSLVLFLSFTISCIFYLQLIISEFSFVYINSDWMNVPISDPRDFLNTFCSVRIMCLFNHQLEFCFSFFTSNTGKDMIGFKPSIKY